MMLSFTIIQVLIVHITITGSVGLWRHAEASCNLRCFCGY